MVRTSKPEETRAIDRTLEAQPAAAEREEEDYFQSNSPPPYLDKLEEEAKSFIKQQTALGKRIALVTSGGTTVPLENNTVRFIDNFSAGTRGATSTEYLLEAGYAVIFLHREFSLEPYSRHFSHTTRCILDYMSISEQDGHKVVVGDQYQHEIKSVLVKYNAAKSSLLKVPFTTVNQYLFTLRMMSEALSQVSTESTSKVLFYLAAAVSDFFLPASKMSEHKIQSKGGGSDLVIKLNPVPKFLRRLVDSWTPGAMIISFKLETDKTILIDKAKGALDRYNHQLVIGNLLQTRKNSVTFVTPRSEPKVFQISDEEIAAGHDIEGVFIPEVIKLHSEWIEKAGQK